MRCEYIFTYRDFNESMKIYRHVSKRAAIGYLLYVWVLPLLALCMGLGCLIAYVRQDAALFGAMFWSSCVGFAVAWGLPVRHRLAMRRAFDQRNALAKNKPMFFEYDDAGTRFVVPNGTEITYPWSSFTNYKENDQVAVLFIQEAAFHTIPKRAMNEDGWIQLRSLIDQHVRKG